MKTIELPNMTLLIALSMAGLAPAHAADDAAAIERLEARIEEQQLRIQALESSLAERSSAGASADQAQVSDRVPPTPATKADTRIDAGPKGFALVSADQAWTLKLRSLVQYDGRLFAADDSGPDENNEWLLRRVRPSLEGSFGERLAFRLMPDFGRGRTELIDAWIDARLTEGLTLRAGKFKPPVGLERLQSAPDLRLIERSVVTELVPNRDLGLELSSRASRLSWAIGLFNGVVDGSSADEDEDGRQNLAARIFLQPFTESGGVFSGLGIGVAATYGDTVGTSAIPVLPRYRSPGQQTVFQYRAGVEGTFADGERGRFSPQFYWYHGPVGLLGEWVRVSQDVRRMGAGFDRSATLDHQAWQLTANWLLTGESAGFRDPSPQHPLDTPGGTGAFELVARVSELEIDEDSFAGGATSFADPAVSVRRAQTWAAGANWFPLRGLKSSLIYHQTSFDGGAAAGDRPDEKLFLGRLQLSF